MISKKKLNKYISAILAVMLAVQPLYAFADEEDGGTVPNDVTENVNIENSVTTASTDPDKKYSSSVFKNEIYKQQDFTTVPDDMTVNDKDLAAIEGVAGEHRYVLGIAEGGEADILADASKVSKWDGTTVDTDWFADPSKKTYSIQTAAELAGLAKLVSTDGVSFSGVTINLLTDVDIDNKEWLPIGLWDTNGNKKPFSGTFNGNGHVVKNIKITERRGSGVGFFGGLNGTVMNLGIDGISISFKNDGDANRVNAAGGLSGFADSSNIESCYVKNISFYNSNPGISVGGFGSFVGEPTGTCTIIDSYSMNMTVKGSPNTSYGEIFGRLRSGNVTLKNVYTSGTFSYNRSGTAYPNITTIQQGRVGASWGTVKLTNVYLGATGVYEDDDNVINGQAVSPTQDVTDEQLKSGTLTFEETSKLLQKSGEYPKHGFYKGSDKTRVKIDFMPEDSAETTFAVTAKDSSKIEFTLSDNKLSIGSISVPIEPDDWNTLEVMADYKSGKANVYVNDAKAAEIIITGDSYSSFKVTSTSKKVLIDNAVMGTDYTAESETFVNAIEEAMEDITLNPYAAATLPEEIGGYDVTWKSSDSSIISDDGQTVTKKAYGRDVTLTATVVMGEYDVIQKPSQTVTYTAYVPPLDGVTDEERLQAIADEYLTLASLTDEKETFITKSLNKLPSSFDGCTITWKSSDTDVMGNDGKVALPETDNASVTLTATVAKGDLKKDKKFNFTVISTDNLISEAKTAIDYKALTSEDNTKIKSDLTLPKKGLYNTVITWESSDESLITSEGYVTRGDNNETVTLTATFTLGGRSSEKEYYFNVMYTDKVMITQDINAFAFTRTTATEDFTVPTKGSVHSSIINWSSDNDAIVISNITGTATVTSPASTASDAVCTLTAKFIMNDEMETKTYTVTVPRQRTDAELVAECKDFITWSEINVCNTDDVRENFSLPEVYDGGVTCTWKSSNPDVITDAGVVIRPGVGESSVEVTLTVTITKNGASDTKSFTFTVAPFDEPAQVLEKAKSELNFRAISDEPINMVSKNLNLATTWRYGTTITWQSDSLYVKTDGTVTRPPFGTSDVEATLTATIAYGSDTVEKKFNIGLVSEGSIVSVLYRDFEDADYGDATDDEFKITKPYEIFDVVDNPKKDTVNSSDKVVMYKREGGENGISQYEAAIYPSETRGSFDFEFDIYIESIPECNFLVRSYSMDGFRVNFTKDGKVIINDRNYATSTSATNTVKIGAWNHILIKYDTLTERQNLYINGKSVFGEKDFIYSKNGNASASRLAFRFDGNNLTKDHVIYFDNMKITRDVNYANFLTAAYEQFEREFISMQNINEVTSNLQIPTVSQFETEVTCKSSNTAVIADDGTVTRPDEDTLVEYTATFSNKWGGSKSRTFYVLVKSKDFAGTPGAGTLDDADSVLADATYVKNYVKSNNATSNITSNLSLPTVGENGSTVTWTSTNSSIITDSGAVTRPSSDTNVIMTAIISKGGVSERITMTFTVKKKSTVNSSTGTGSGSGSGSSSGISGGIPGGTSPTQKPQETEKPSETPTPSEQPTQSPEPTDAPSSSDGKYSDVSSSHWAHTAVGKLSDEGIVDGYDDGSFGANDSVKREQFAKMTTLLGGYESDNGENLFTDVADDAWYAPYVAAAYEKGIVSGMDDGTFGIGMNISRQDMCLMIYNLLKSEIDLPESDGNSFNDSAEISDYALEAVNVLSAAGVVNGDDDGNFNPTSGATRAEAAQMLYNALKLLGK